MRVLAGTTWAYSLRCAGACALAYGLATWLGLQQGIWAAISAIVVSQERFSDTRASLASRIAGTALGAAIAVLVGAPGAHLPLVVETAVGVALAAAFAHRFPSLRVAMWTCPIVLMTADASQSLAGVALRRASEVGLGAVVGWAAHWAAETLSASRET